MLSTRKQQEVSAIHTQHLKRIRYDATSENTERSKRMFEIDVQKSLHYKATIEWITASWCIVAVSSKRDKLPTRGNSFGKHEQPYWSDYLKTHGNSGTRSKTGEH